MILAQINLKSLVTEKWLAELGENLFFLLLGTVVSFYATIVFERYKRFGDIIRGIGQARVHFEGYPVSPADLPRAHLKSIEYWRFLESQQWTLDAEGHYKAATHVARLVAFAYRTGVCIEHMLKDQGKGNSIDVYLMAFQSEYQEIHAKKFIQFEATLRPNRWSLLRPRPRSAMPTRGTAVVVDYFDRLLR